jgi:peptidyl-prolyl cis-trans isomerase B (cyclophilin B)
MQRSFISAVLFSMTTCALVACGNDQPKSGETSTASSQSAPAKSTPPAAKATDSKSADAKPTESKTATATSTDAKSTTASTAKSDAGAGAPAAADKPVEKPKTDPSVDPAIATMREFIDSKKIDKTSSNWRTKVPMPPKLTFDPKKTYFWVLDTTEGPIKIRLMPDVAPMHVSSTIYLTELGFYDGLLFHRVIPGFMAQGGDPLGNGSGGPAYHYATEFSPKARHSKAGILSMANAGPNTEGSQFFLTFVPTPFLDDKHTVFGDIVEGLDNLKKMEAFGSSPNGTTTKKLAINSAKIEVK